MAERGRPSKYTPEVAERIVQGVADGLSLRKVCEPDDMPAEATVRRWVIDDTEGFSAQYTRARDIGLDCRADALVEEAKAAKDASLGRLSFDADRWYLSKLAPKRYGDRVTQELTGPDGGAIQTQGSVRVEGAPEDVLRWLASQKVEGGEK